LARGPAAAAVSALLLAAHLGGVPAASADIFRWEDEQGTIHFTDDLQTVPPAARPKARRVIRDAPAERKAAPPSTEAQAGPQPRPRPAPESAGGADAAREELVARIEQLRAKIAAKEELIDRVDRKRSLAVNPLRNRFVDAADMELYAKYQAELPADRKLLSELEARLAEIDQTSR